MAGNALIRLRRDVAADWTTADPTLALAEPGFEEDTNRMKIGDGTTAWSSLDYFADHWNAGYLEAADNLSDVANVATARSNLSVYSTAQVDSAIAAAVTGLLDLKGNTDCSANPNYPAASKGDAYYVTVAGKIGGASGKTVEVGDLYVAAADNAGGNEASVGTDWFVLEHNLVGALVATNNLSDVTSPSTARTNLGLAIGSDVQAYDADLAAIAALATTNFGRSLLTMANIDALRAVGICVQVAPTTQAGTSYTGVLGDAGGYVLFTNAAAIAFTIPPNASVAYPLGTIITFEQNGTGVVTVTAGAGVTLHSRGGFVASAGQYAVVQVKQVAADVWTIIGDVA